MRDGTGSHAVHVFQFGSVLGHAEQNEGPSRAGPRGEREVPCSAHYHVPLHITTRRKLAHRNTGRVERGGER